MILRYLQCLACAVMAIAFTGCLTYKQIVNFQDGQDLEDGRVEQIRNLGQVRVQPDDILQINVHSVDESAVSMFNMFDARQQSMMMRGGAGGLTNAIEPIGYRIDNKGYLTMPGVGKIYVKGLTVEEIQETLYQKIDSLQYLKDFTVHVRFLSFRITILGEVGNPGTYTLPNSKINILEAIGMASDLTIFSNRDNILVIREQDGKRAYGRVNIKTKDIFKSPFYYLQPNDVIYVEPHKAKILSAPDPASRYVRTIIATVSLLTLVITQIL